MSNYHLVGVAGSGMSSLAQILAGSGHQVSGSDRHKDRGEELPVLKKLERVGVQLFPQDGSGARAAKRIVVVSSAIESDNPDLLAAQSIGAEIVMRGEMLGRIASKNQCVAVAGTSGKSTVSGMLGWIFEYLELDPTVAVGGNLRNWSGADAIGNARVGKSRVWVVEADESDRSLLSLKPERAIITNIAKDHFGLQETRDLFDKFVEQIPAASIIGPGTEQLPVEMMPGEFSVGRFRYKDVPFELHLPGSHNVENAIHAVALCDQMALDLKRVAEALQSFQGIERRLELVGSARGITVIDDYGHNPAKIRAAWQAVANHFSRVVGIWRPHGFGPLAFMEEELVNLLAELCRPEDSLCVLPVYYAGGTTQRKTNSWSFAALLRARGVQATVVSDYESCARHVLTNAAAGDVVLSMGARDPFLPRLARQIVRALSDG